MNPESVSKREFDDFDFKQKVGFLSISWILERVLMEYIGMKNSSDSKLKICSICYVRILSRN